MGKTIVRHVRDRFKLKPAKPIAIIWNKPFSVDIREIMLCVYEQQEELFPEIAEYRGLEWIN